MPAISTDNEKRAREGFPPARLSGKNGDSQPQKNLFPF
jgi:hypothetical protein